MNLEDILPLSKLKRGEWAVIVSLDNSHLGLKLMEMGCLPGEEVLLKKVAPLGDPISIQIGSYLLSLRKKEAFAVKVRKIPSAVKTK
jgi:ferrous iron transport protein A